MKNLETGLTGRRRKPLIVRFLFLIIRGCFHKAAFLFSSFEIVDGFNDFNDFCGWEYDTFITECQLVGLFFAYLLFVGLFI